LVDKSVWSTGGMILTKEDRSSVRKNLPHYHFVYHKFQSDCPGIEPSERPVTNHLYDKPFVLILNYIADDGVV